MKKSIYIVCCLTLICLVSCTYRSNAHQGENNTIIVDTILSDNLSQTSTDPNLKTDTLKLDNDTITYASKPSSKDLEKLKNLISSRLEHLNNNPLKDYVWGVSVLDSSVLVSMALNNPYWQSEFRKNISTSPYIEFKGFYKPTLISKLVDTITKQSEIKLQPDSSSFPVNSQFATFTLSNDSKEKIEFGFQYIIGYKGTDNQWYKLPNPDVWQEAVIGLMPSEKYAFKAVLLPILNKNKAGTYRLYKKIFLGGKKGDIWIMTEFKLE